MVFALLWQLPPGFSQTFYFWFFLIGSIFFYLAYTVYATPWVALGYEMTPDYNERTRLMGFANWIGQIAWVAAPWFYMIMENKRFFDDPVEGARTLAIFIGIFVAVVGLVPAIFCRERMGKAVQAEESDPTLTLCDSHYPLGYRPASGKRPGILLFAIGISDLWIGPSNFFCYGQTQWPRLLLWSTPSSPSGIGGSFSPSWDQ